MAYKDKEKQREYNKKYRQLHAEELKKYMKEYAKNYRQTHRNKFREYSKKYREKYKDRINKRNGEYIKKYRELNKGKIQKYNKEYYKSHKGYYRDYNKINREKNRETMKEYRKQYYQMHKNIERERNRQYKKIHAKEMKEYMKIYSKQYLIEHREALRESEKQYWRKHKIRAKEIRLLSKYDIDLDRLFAMLKSQKYKCAICEKKINEKTACVDHSHKTLAIRGLLCQQCNIWLGHYEKLSLYEDRIKEYLSSNKYDIIYTENTAIKYRSNILKKQNFECAICHSKLTSKRACLDHRHDDSKLVRGVLCVACNAELGIYEKMLKYKDTIDKYLARGNKCKLDVFKMEEESECSA